jgi:4-amino-4-deoxy-L-arabinose transferase-like glycosyltransferase
LTTLARKRPTPFAWRLGAIACAGFLWELLYINWEPPVGILTDEAWYIGEARNLFGAHPWTSIFNSSQPTAQHGPLTSIIVAPFAWLFPHALESLRDVSALVGVGTIVLLAMAAREWRGDRAGLIAAAIVAAFPDFWVRDGLVAPEPVAACLAAGAVWTLFKLYKRVTPARVVVLGVLAGLVALSRPEDAPILLLIGVVIVLRHAEGRGFARRVGMGALAIACALAVIAPWSAYNEGRFKDPVFISNDLGITLAGANCTRTYYNIGIVGYDSAACWFKEFNKYAKDDESVQSASMRDDAFHFVVHHLDRVPLVVVMREAWFLGVYRPDWVVFMNSRSQRAWATWCQAIGFYLAIVAATALWWRRRKDDWPHWILGLLAANSFVVAALFVGHWRYRITLDLTLVLAIAWGIDAWMAKRRALTT